MPPKLNIDPKVDFILESVKTLHDHEFGDTYYREKYKNWEVLLFCGTIGDNWTAIAYPVACMHVATKRFTRFIDELVSTVEHEILHILMFDEYMNTSDEDWALFKIEDYLRGG